MKEKRPLSIIVNRECDFFSPKKSVNYQKL